MEREAYVLSTPRVEIPPLFSEEEQIVTVTVDRSRSPIDAIIASTHPKKNMQVDLRSIVLVPKKADTAVEVVFFKYDQNKTKDPNYVQQFLDPTKKEGRDFSISYPGCFSWVDIDNEIKRRGLEYDPIAVATVYESQLAEFERTHGNNELQSIALWKTESGWHVLKYNRDGRENVIMGPIGFWEGRRADLPGSFWIAGVRKKK